MIINTFISDEHHDIPEYTLICLNQLRKLNPDTEIHFIADHIEPYSSFFKKNEIDFIPQKSVNSDLLTEFNRASWLKAWGRPSTTYESPNYFFHRAMERIYYLQAWIEKNKFSQIFHCENDVICYYPIEECDFSHEFMITPSSPTQSTMAVSYIHNSEAINNVCRELNRLLKLGNEKLLEFNPEIDMINEMSLLKICHTLGIINHLNIFPGDIFVYDPSSYGQFLGGTNNGHGSGFTSENHYLGNLLKSGIYQITWKNSKPFVNDWPLFNLHIHSKNLKDFINKDSI